MKPIEFIHFGGDSSPNTPVHKIYEAMENHIKIFDGRGEFEILSYYYNEEDKCMVLEISR